MSTTSNLAVAVRYSLSTGSLLFKVKVESWTDHGAGGHQSTACPFQSACIYTQNVIAALAKCMCLHDSAFKVP